MALHLLFAEIWRNKKHDFQLRVAMNQLLCSLKLRLEMMLEFRIAGTRHQGEHQIVRTDAVFGSVDSARFRIKMFRIEFIEQGMSDKFNSHAVASIKIHLK